MILGRAYNLTLVNDALTDAAYLRDCRARVSRGKAMAENRKRFEEVGPDNKDGV